MIAGCPAEQATLGPATGQTISECPGANGPDMHIWYGDSKINVTNRVKTTSDGKLVIKLHPDNSSDEGIDYSTLDITLVGKDSASNWLTRTLNASEQNTKKATICVDGKPVGVYQYMVVVPGVGTIDPRVDIEK
jgi:hypothetical protein